MKTYLTYDADGNLTGCYRQEMHPDHEGAAIEVDDATAAAWPGFRMNSTRDGLETLPAADAGVLLPGLKQTLADTVDATIAGIYARFLRFEAEYVAREAAARAYVAAGYTGDPGVWVTGFSGPAGLPENQAADLIISQADSLRAALAALGALRMAKYSIFAAATADAANTVFNSIESQAAAIAANL